MTQASKARKRKPMRVITMPKGDIPPRLAEMASLLGARWLPMGTKVEYIHPRPRPTLTVLPATATAGVGGRRHRRRRRALERRWDAQDRAWWRRHWAREQWLAALPTVPCSDTF